MLKNDGLPVINGKKVRRRIKAGVSSPYRNTSGDYSSLKTCLLWLAAGAAVILFVSTERGEHVQPGSGGVSPQEVASTVQASAEVASTTTTASAPGGGYGFPDKCTTEQLDLVKKQLPSEPLGHRPWRDASFSIATVRSGYVYNPILMREFYASDAFSLNTNVHSFFGVSIGWGSNDIPIDALAIGSRDPKYQTKPWNDKLGKTANQVLPPVTIDSASGKRPARFLVLESVQKDPSIQSLKEAFKYTDDELVVSTGGVASLYSNMPAVNGKVAPDQPIHYINMFRARPTTVEQLLRTPFMKQTRFLHFQYDKDWGNGTLSKLLGKLRKEGLVCYFPGKKEIDYGMWRITDCFLDHFDQPHWADISCVNVQHDDVKVLAEKMEKKFLETIQKSHTFPAHKTSF